MPIILLRKRRVAQRLASVYNKAGRKLFPSIYLPACPAIALLLSALRALPFKVKNSITRSLNPRPITVALSTSLQPTKYTEGGKLVGEKHLAI